MFKKEIIKKAAIASAVAGLALTGAAYANGGTYQPAPHATHSVYVGVAVSRDFFQLENISDSRGSLDLGNDGWNGELNGGIGWVFQDHYYLGAEIFGTVNSAEINVGRDSLKYKYSYGIDLVPGVKISDSTMLYGKVGYIGAEFDASGSRFGSKDKNKSGLQLGLGLETMVTNNVSTKIEYDYNTFSKFNGIRPVVNSVKLGVAYHFMSA